MTARTTLLLTLATLGCAGMTAQAEPLRLAQMQMPAERGLPSYDVATMLRSMDLNPVAPPMRRGPNYVVRATDRYGNLLRVVIDARVGEIVRMRPVHRPRMVDYSPPPGFVSPAPYAAPYPPPPPGWREPAPRWGDNYVPEYGEVPPPRVDVPTLRQNPAPQARLSPETESGPSVIYADPHQAHLPPVPPRTSALGHVAPLAHPPVPRPRPDGDEHAALQPDVSSAPAPEPPQAEAPSAAPQHAAPPAAETVPPLVGPSRGDLANDDAPIPPPN
jgi:hypothetical protein